MLTVKVIQNIQSWDLDADNFNRLAGDYFTRRTDWAKAWWQTYQSQYGSLYIIQVLDADATIGYLPLCLSCEPGSSRKLTFLGSGKACSDDLRMLAESGREADVANQIADYLYKRGQAGEWDEISLDGIRIGNRSSQQLLKAFRATFGSGFHETQDQSCWELALPKLWDDYLAMRSRGSRHAAKKLIRTYFDTRRAVISMPNSQSEALEHLELICDLHQARWHDRDMAGCIDSDGFEEFLQNACRAMWAAGQWFSILMHLDGQLSTGMIGVLADQRLATYLIGMDPQTRQHSPGILLNYASMQYAMERGCNTFDCMRGDEVYKARFGAEPISQYIWSAAAPRFIPRLRSTVQHARGTMKQWLADSTRQWRQPVGTDS